MMMVTEVKDPAFKLFGATIPVPGGGGGHDSVVVVKQHVVVHEVPSAGCDNDKDAFDHKDSDPESKEKEQESPKSDGSSDDERGSSNPDDTQRSSAEEDSPTAKNSSSGEQSGEKNNNQQEKQTLKKPDKILPCPRCNSLDTKFCYYNNYNVNQPRHFCKNCQRYWTAGGTMRNVPVGAGRRKNKSSANRNVVLPDAALQSLQSNLQNSFNNLQGKPNGTVLSFGPDAPLCESMASVLKIAERNGFRNGFHSIDELKIKLPVVENGEDNSSASSVTASNSTEEGCRANPNEQLITNYQGILPAMPCYNGTPWPYPWPPTAPFCAPSFPVPIYPAAAAAAAYWGCAVPGAWPVPWIAPLASPTSNGSSAMSSSSSSGPNSPLGKHSRDGTLLNSSSNSDEKEPDTPKKANQEGGGIWIPKTLRMDDPETAAKSSIWASIGITREKSDCATSAAFFKGFQAKDDLNCQASSASQVLRANPAAFSRSISFQERS